MARPSSGSSRSTPPVAGRPPAVVGGPVVGDPAVGSSEDGEGELGEGEALGEGEPVGGGWTSCAATVSSLSAGTSSRPPDAGVAGVADRGEVGVGVQDQPGRHRRTDRRGARGCTTPPVRPRPGPAGTVRPGAVNETNLVPGGSGSDRLGLGAMVGPRLVRRNSKTTGSPADRRLGDDPLVHHDVGLGDGVHRRRRLVVPLRPDHRWPTTPTRCWSAVPPAWSRERRARSPGCGWSRRGCRRARSVTGPAPVHPAGRVCTVVPAGMDSVSTTSAASDGPSLVTTSVYAIVPPSSTPLVAGGLGHRQVGLLDHLDVDGCRVVRRVGVGHRRATPTRCSSTVPGSASAGTVAAIVTGTRRSGRHRAEVADDVAGVEPTARVGVLRIERRTARAAGRSARPRVASDGPVLVTVTVKTVPPPAATVSASAVLVRLRSARSPERGGRRVRHLGPATEQRGRRGRRPPCWSTSVPVMPGSHGAGDGDQHRLHRIEGDRRTHRAQLAAHRLAGERAVALGGRDVGRHQPGRQGVGDHHVLGVGAQPQRRRGRARSEPARTAIW